MDEQRSSASCFAVNSSMFLAIRTTFWFTLSQYDFVVFALKRSLIVPQVSLSTSVRPFVNRCANSLNDFRHCCLNEVVLLINFVRLILTRLAFERFRRFSYAFGCFHLFLRHRKAGQSNAVSAYHE